MNFFHKLIALFLFSSLTLIGTSRAEIASVCTLKGNGEYQCDFENKGRKKEGTCVRMILGAKPESKDYTVFTGTMERIAQHNLIELTQNLIKPGDWKRKVTRTEQVKNIYELTGGKLDAENKHSHLAFETAAALDERYASENYVAAIKAGNAVLEASIISIRSGGPQLRSEEASKVQSETQKVSANAHRIRETLNPSSKDMEMDAYVLSLPSVEQLEKDHQYEFSVLLSSIKKNIKSKSMEAHIKNNLIPLAYFILGGERKGLSNEICSGLVEPGDLRERRGIASFSGIPLGYTELDIPHTNIFPADVCKVEGGDMPWTDACSFSTSSLTEIQGYIKKKIQSAP